MNRSFRKEKWMVFLLCLLVMLAVFGIMLTERFSTDGYSDYYLSVNGTSARVRLEAGRVGGAIVEEILYRLGVNTAFFEGRQWDSFDPEEQVILIGDTLYLAVY